MLKSLRLIQFALSIQLMQYCASDRVVKGQESPWVYEYTKYHPMSEIYSWMERVVDENPDLVSSSVYGHTFEGRNISLLKIGTRDPEGGEKKAVWIDCGIHAREWIAPAFCQWFVKEILQGHKTSESIQLMLRNLDIYVTPVLNVDGYIYSWASPSNRLWRKSRSTPPAGCDCHGVDLNRNFYANWGTEGVSFDCCRQTYCGQGAVSEKEAQAVTEFVGNRTEQILLFLTIHSHGQLLLLPYGHPQIRAPNHYELVRLGQDAAAAMKAVHGMGYTVGTSPQVLYPNSGSSRDWARLVGIPYSYTFELRDKGQFGHELPEEQIQPACEEAFVGAVVMITYVHDKTFGNAAAAVTAVSTVTIWSSVMAVGLTTWVLV